MPLSSKHHDNQADLIFPEKLLYRSAYGNMEPLAGTATDLTSSNEGFAIPLTTPVDLTIEYIDVMLTAGSAGDFRCRIVNHSSANLPDTSSLAHENADETINTGDSSEWVRFDFTNFVLNSGHYHIVLTASGESFDININTSDWTRPTLYYDSSCRCLYHDGTDWETNWDSAPMVRVMSTDGYVQGGNRYFGIPGTSTSYTMDATENPSCRGTGLTLPYSGMLNGVWICTGAIDINTSFHVAIVAASDPDIALARTEVDFRQRRNPTHCAFVPFADLAEVRGGEDYYIYYTAGSNATASEGVTIYEIDFSDDANLLQLVGLPNNGLYAVQAHQPPSEGGSGTWSETSGKAFSLAVQYGQIHIDSDTEDICVW